MAVVDYDTVAHEYDRRYELHDYPGIRRTILSLIEEAGRAHILEVGCGTGKWLRLLASVGCAVAGLDPSDEMLGRAAANVSGDLRRGSADALPWGDRCFDLVLYINAFHHFAAPEAALRESFRVLRPGGKLVSIGLDPHEKKGRWYVYEFFPATVALDLARFPSRAVRTRWIKAAGFTEVSVSVTEHLRFSRSFQEALRDGILERSFTSQLTALSFDEYSDGMSRIRQAAAEDEAFRLDVDLTLHSTEARRPV